MPATKGRRVRPRRGGTALYATIDPGVRELLDAGAKALNISVAEYLEEFVRSVPVDEHGLPEWARERLEMEQLPLQDSA